jgi:hypothetical protein
LLFSFFWSNQTTVIQKYIKAKENHLEEGKSSVREDRDAIQDESIQDKARPNMQDQDQMQDKTRQGVKEKRENHG